MLKTNEKITFSGAELIEVLKEIEVILISLHKIDSFYAIKHYEGEYIYDGEYDKETTRFIVEWKVISKLAKIRGILSEKFDDTLGEDLMDDVEREMEELTYWTAPGDDSKDIKNFEKEDADTE